MKEGGSERDKPEWGSEEIGEARFNHISGKFGQVSGQDLQGNRFKVSLFFDHG